MSPIGGNCVSWSTPYYRGGNEKMAAVTLFTTSLWACFYMCSSVKYFACMAVNTEANCNKSLHVLVMMPSGICV